jgi:hypothetical protein
VSATTHILEIKAAHSTMFMHYGNVLLALTETTLMGGLPIRWSEVILAPLTLDFYHRRSRRAQVVLVLLPIPAIEWVRVRVLVTILYVVAGKSIVYVLTPPPCRIPFSVAHRGAVDKSLRFHRSS